MSTTIDQKLKQLIGELQFQCILYIQQIEDLKSDIEILKDQQNQKSAANKELIK